MSQFRSSKEENIEYQIQPSIKHSVDDRSMYNSITTLSIISLELHDTALLQTNLWIEPAALYIELPRERAVQKSVNITIACTGFNKWKYIQTSPIPMQIVAN